MKSSRIKAVIFDCDGTLVDSEELTLGVLVKMATELGLSSVAAFHLKSMRGEAMSACFSFIRQNIGQPLPPNFEYLVRQSMADSFRMHLKAMPGAREVVERMQLLKCVATNGPRSRAELTLGITGLLDGFENHIYCAPEVGSYKPDPGLFHFAASKLNVQSFECAVVEDSLPGMRAGLMAGMKVYTVLTTHTKTANLPQQVQILDRLEDLLDQLAIQ